MILAARYVLLEPGRVLVDAALRVERGKVVEVLEHGARAAARGGLDFEDGLLAPGFVNAHAHLELGDLAGRLPAAQGFTSWVGSLLRERALLGASDFERAVVRGAGQLLTTGTTAIGDIDSTGASQELAAGLGPRMVVQREVLDAWDERRTPSALSRVSRALPASQRVREGLSPHAPYTTSSGLLGALAKIVARRGLGLSIHWAETREEGAWLERGEGPLAAVLPPSPGTSGLDLLAQAGLLGPHTTLVHGNHPGPGELARLAAARVRVVHCPGTHRFFEREPFPLADYRAAGVPLALGTDSLASNGVLDMRREMALARETLGLDAQEALTLATTAAAEAIGWPELGRIAPGGPADLVLHRLGSGTPADLLDELTRGGGTVEQVWVHGRAALG